MVNYKSPEIIQESASDSDASVSKISPRKKIKNSKPTNSHEMSASSDEGNVDEETNEGKDESSSSEADIIPVSKEVARVKPLEEKRSRLSLSKKDKTPSKSKSPGKLKHSPLKSRKDEGAFNPNDLDLHSLDEDADEYQLWLIKMPSDLPLSSIPKEFMLNAVHDFSNQKKRYEVRPFEDELLQKNYISFVKGEDEDDPLIEGPQLHGQIHVIQTPEVRTSSPITVPHITSKPVPFPTGLKKRFVPFGAAAPNMRRDSPSKRKHKKRKSSENIQVEDIEETDSTPKKKKKKKKHKQESLD